MRVIDCSRVLAGPYCAVLLGHLGAEVIKVEHPGGDEGRTWPPHRDDMSASFLALNVGKRSVVVDLDTAEGPGVVADLAAGSDVLIENFKAGSMERFGLGFEALSRRNPRLVYVSVSAFGPDGPRAAEPGYEAVVQAYSGVMAATGEPGGGPVRTGPSVLDMGTGALTAFATVAALLRRERSGVGGRVEGSLLATAMGLMSNLMSNHLQHGGGPARLGSAHPQLVPYQAFEAADGHVFMAAGNDNLYRRLCDALGRPDLATDPRFVANGSRVRNREACVAEIAAVVRDRAVLDVVSELRGRGVPVSPVNDFEALVADGQLDHTGVLAEGDDPAYGRFVVPALPVRLDGSDVATVDPAPRLGADTESVLRDVLGYDEERIAGLFELGAVGGTRSSQPARRRGR